MFQKMPNFVFIVLILGSSCFVKGNNNSSNSALRNKTPQPMQDQAFNINNCGFRKADRKMLTEMKYKIDSLYDKVCPDNGWVHYGNSRFLVINIPTLKWSDARRTCQMLGGDLAIIRSAAENNFIFALVKKQKTVTALGAWLGFVRKGDKFYWIDDTPLAKGYAAWASGQPDINLLEKCGNMFGTGSEAGKWNDVPCERSPESLKHAPVILCKKEAD